ncbi:MAG: hypothetical protein ACI35W_01560 [Anaeroplasmataceae bacterium]
MRISDEDIRNYQIKTTSNMILNEVNKVNTKPKFQFRFKLGISLSSLFVAACSIILIIALLPSNDTPKNIEGGDTDTTINVDEEVLNFQVSSLVSIISNDINTALLNTSLSITDDFEYEFENPFDNNGFEDPFDNRFEDPFNNDNNKEVDEDFFNDVIKEYQLFEDVIYNKYYKIEEEITYNYNEYKGMYDDYKLMLGYNNYKIYVNYINKDDEESEFEGEIDINGTIYRIEGKEEKDIDELELSTKIYLSDDEYYLVKEEYEDDEYSYKFSIKSKNKEKYEYKLKIEDDEISFKIDSNEKKFEYEIKVEDDKKWVIGFNGSDNKFDFSLEIDEAGKKNYRKF